MAIYRQIQTSFWQDGFVMELTPEEKYFYFYLMTNPRTTQCGIFELPKRIAEAETGYSRETIDKLLKRFIDYGKILYCEEAREIMILNWMKYNFINSRNTILCINKELKTVKNKEFISRLYKICMQLGYEIENIFNGVDLTEENTGKSTGENNELSKGSQGACKPLSEKETEKETQIQKESLNKQETNKILLEFNKKIRQATCSDIEKINFLRKEFQDEVIVQAIHEAVQRKAAHPAYIWTILGNWKNMGLFTMEKLKEYRGTRDTSKCSSSNRCNEDAYRYVE